MKYSTWSQDAALAVLATLRDEKGAVLMALQALQKEFGYVHKEDVTLVANFFNKSRADVHGVLTFYHDLLTEAPADNHISVCVAKTQYSFSTDAALRGAPSGHSINVREVKLSAGAEFIVMICGEIMTMPGLPKVPSAERIDYIDGKVVGLF